jgi:Ser/Thr protein kinase RdoA (MazF antagonist)
MVDKTKTDITKYSEVRKIIFEAWPKAKIKSLKEFPEGYNNLAYDVRLDNGDYVIKLLKIKGYEKYVLKQKHIRTLVRKKFKEFPIPKIIKSDFSKKLVDKPYIIAEKIDGNSFLSEYNNVNNKADLNEQIGELYGKLHSFKFETYGELDHSLKPIKTYKNWYLEKIKQTRKFIKKIEENKILPPKKTEEIKEFFEDKKTLLKKEVGPVLCHGDSSHTNILVKKIGNMHIVTGIIDFEFARSSGPVQELFYGIRTFNRKFKYRKSLVQGYTKWNKLPEEWEELANLYSWMANIEQLTRINKMKWRNLDETKTKARKKEIKRDNLLELNRVMKELN